MIKLDNICSNNVSSVSIGIMFINLSDQSHLVDIFHQYVQPPNICSTYWAIFCSDSGTVSLFADCLPTHKRRLRIISAPRWACWSISVVTRGVMDDFCFSFLGGSHYISWATFDRRKRLIKLMSKA